jgi:hypothetical protein
VEICYSIGPAVSRQLSASSHPLNQRY